MKKALFTVFVLAVLLSGCLEPEPGDPEPKLVDFELDEETQFFLMAEFACDISVSPEVQIGETIVFECISEDKHLAGSGIYQIGAHPMGVWSVTYIVYDGARYDHVKVADDLVPYFVPIDSTEKALDFVVLHEGLFDVQRVLQAPLAGNTTSVAQGQNFIVTVLNASHNLCPCYGAYWKTVYEVTPQGGISRKSSEEVYSYEETDCLC